MKRWRVRKFRPCQIKIDMKSPRLGVQGLRMFVHMSSFPLKVEVYIALHCAL